MMLTVDLHGLSITGPSVAIPDVCRKAGVAIEDIDVFELNEAFASQVCEAP